jgi:hypothetical protein
VVCVCVHLSSYCPFLEKLAHAKQARVELFLLTHTRAGACYSRHCVLFPHPHTHVLFSSRSCAHRIRMRVYLRMYARALRFAAALRIGTLAQSRQTRTRDSNMPLRLFLSLRLAHIYVYICVQAAAEDSAGTRAEAVGKIEIDRFGRGCVWFVASAASASCACGPQTHSHTLYKPTELH